MSHRPFRLTVTVAAALLRRLSHWPFRVTMTVAAVLLFNQAIFAGRMLSGSFPALHTHRENATVAGVAVLVAAVSAIPLRWPGRGPLWPALAGLGLFGLIALQILLGFRRTLVVHVPLGVSIIALGVLLAVWAWRYRPPSPGERGQPAAGPMTSPTAALVDASAATVRPAASRAAIPPEAAPPARPPEAAPPTRPPAPTPASTR